MAGECCQVFAALGYRLSVLPVRPPGWVAHRSGLEHKGAFPETSRFPRGNPRSLDVAPLEDLVECGGLPPLWHGGNSPLSLDVAPLNVRIFTQSF